MNFFSISDTLSVDDFELEIKKEFINEALINLEEVEGSFMELESSQDTKPLLDKIFRMAHNLKGGSRAVGFGDVAEFTHNLENLVLKIQKGEVTLNSEVVTTLLRCNDRLVEMLSELKVNLSATFKNDDLIANIKMWLDGAGAAVKTEAPPEAPQPESAISNAATEVASENQVFTTDEAPPAVPDANTFFEAEAEAVVAVPSVAVAAPAPVLAPVAAAPPSAPPAARAPTSEKEDEVIRVNLSRIDLLNDYVGELIVMQSVIQQQSQETQSSKLMNSVHQMLKLSKDIQGLAMGLRMLPVKPLIQKLQRVVRDTAKALDKEVVLDVVGEQIDIDKSVLDRLSDPLIHILRNAVDHGLEQPKTRTENGKSSAGRVQLTFANEGNHLIVEVRDDGKGINTSILREKAIEKGLISAAQGMTEKQLIHLIFHPGFSTKSVTSEISGRGVGMDVVKTNIEKIGGVVEVSTKLGAGSVFRLQIPLTLAVIEGMVVLTPKSRFVIPLSQVQETVSLKTQKLFFNKIGIGSCIELRGAIVPLFNLEDALSNQQSNVDIDSTCLIINVEGRPVGLLVKEILRSQQIVIKPIGSGIQNQKGWVGSCVLGDGLPTLIVSPVDILDKKIIQISATNNQGLVA
jgi:two-component system, chemotaxis family, sensor kinase CheA